MDADAAASTFGSSHGAIRFTLSIGRKLETEAGVVVERVTGQEALSELFVYEIVVVSSIERGEAFAKDLSRDVGIEVVRDDAVVRRVRGILAEVHPDGATLANDRQRTKLVILPKLAELQRVKRSRVYKKDDDESKGFTTQDIVMKLLEEWNIPKEDTEWRINRYVDKYVLRTQFQETSYEFMRRLLAFEGIHFYFLHGPKKTIVVFTNSPGVVENESDGSSMSKPKRPTLPFDEAGNSVSGERIRRIRRGERIPTDRVILNDFNYEKPSLKMSTPNENFSMRAEPEKPREGKRVFYEHPGGYAYPEKVGKGRAQQRLDELNDGTLRFFGESNSARLSAGFRFEVTRHNVEAFNRELVATQVVFTAIRSGAARDDSEAPLAGEFRAVPSETRLGPPSRPSPVPPIQTAVVVGPKADEPHVRMPGRVKVRFYWDDETPDESEEQHCAWARVGTDMAGPGYGTVVWPRVGMEVIVDFLNGKLDEPVVIRALYNGDENGVHSPPYHVPAEQNRTGFKSSSVGGDGHNEWYFDDTAGKELVYLHAQRDRNVVVKASDNESVGGSQTVSVGGAQTESIGGAQTISVGGPRTETVAEAETVTVTGARTHTIHGDIEKLDAKSFRQVNVGLDQTVNVGGHHRMVVTREDHLDVGQGRHHTIKAVDELEVKGGNRLVKVHGSQYTDVDDRLHMGAKTIDAVASDQVEIKCGASTVCLKPESLTITCGSQVVAIKKDGSVSIAGSKEIKIDGGGSSVVLDSTGVTVKGTMIKLNC